MKKIALSGWCLMFSIFFLPAQNPVAFLQRADSMVMDGYRGYPMAQKDGFCFFDPDKSAFEKYDFSGRLKERIVLDSSSLEKFPGLYQAHVWEADDQIILMPIRAYKLYFFDKTGAFQYTRNLDMKFKGDRYFIKNPYALSQTSYAGVVQKDNTLLIPLIRKKEGNYRENDSEGFRAAQRMLFKESGLVGVFSLNGELLEVFGDYDSVYQQEKIFLHLADYRIGQTEDGSVLLSFLLGDRVAVYQHGEKKMLAGARGAYFNKTPDQYPAVKTLLEHRGNSPKPIIEIPLYGDCNVAAQRYLVRSYAIAIEDTVQFTPAEIAKKGKWLRGELQGCLLRTKHDQEQAMQIGKKPCFVQVFDLKTPDAPLYDGPIDLPYPIFLGMRDPEEFLFASAFHPKEGEKQVVYVYRLTKDKLR